MNNFKTTLLFVALFSFAFVGSSLGQERFIDKNEVDEFTGQRTVLSQTVGITVLQRGQGNLWYHKGWVAYTEGSSDYTYLLLFSTASDGWIFLDTDTAYFLVDGQRFEKSLIDVEREVMDGGSISHNMVVRLNRQFRNALRDASEVKVKMGRYVLDVTAVVDDELRAVERAVNGE